MKISLILPPCTQKELFGELAGSNPVIPPLYIASVASYLEGQGHNLKIWDCFAGQITMQKLKELLLKEKPQFVGITVDLPSLSSPLLPQAYQVARLCKQIDVHIKVCFYGYYPTRFPKQVLARDEVDFVVMGEGEITTADLLRSVEDESSLDIVQGLGFKREGKIVINQERELIRDLDSLPIPAYHLLSMGKYKFCPTSRKKKKQMTIMSSRGCPFCCYLCTSPLFWRRRFRAHSPEYVVKNLDYLHEKYGIMDFQFRDDIFTCKRERVVQFCSLLKKKGRKYAWNCYATFNTIDEGLIRLMKEAGCYQLDLGVETGSETILKDYKKIAKEEIKNLMKVMKKLNMETRLFFIMGPPSETKQDIEKTIDFAIELDPDYVIFSPSAPYPGNGLYDQLIEKNYPVPDFEKKVFVENEAICDLPGFDKKYINEMTAKAFRRFYLRPKYILKKLISIRSIYDLKSYFDGFIPLMSFLSKKNEH